ncbi:MAG: STAS domain-containing protein [Planctomycetota bacterium]
MRIEQQRHGAVSVMRPRGPVNNEADAAQLSDTGFDLLGKTLGRFVLDASDMPFVDSNGLEALVGLTNELNAGGRSLCLCGAGETLREILNITEQSSLFLLHEDVPSAVRSFL